MKAIYDLRGISFYHYKFELHTEYNKLLILVMVFSDSFNWNCRIFPFLRSKYNKGKVLFYWKPYIVSATSLTEVIFL